MPDQPSTRRRLQFRLRTLMIAVTLFTVIAGMWKAFGLPIHIYRRENWGGDDGLVVEPSAHWFNAVLFVALVLIMIRVARRSDWVSDPDSHSARPNLLE